MAPFTTLYMVGVVSLPVLVSSSAASQLRGSFSQTPHGCKIREDPYGPCGQSHSNLTHEPTAPNTAACSADAYPQGTIDLRGYWGGSPEYIKYVDVPACIEYFDYMKELGYMPGDMNALITCESMKFSISQIIYQDCLAISITDFQNGTEGYNNGTALHNVVADGKYVISDMCFGRIPCQWISTLDEPYEDEDVMPGTKVLVFTGQDTSTAVGAAYGPNYYAPFLLARRYIDSNGDFNLKQIIPNHGMLYATMRKTRTVTCGNAADPEICKDRAYPDSTMEFEPPCCCQYPLGTADSFTYNHPSNATLTCRCCQSNSETYYLTTKERHGSKQEGCPADAPYTAACSSKTGSLLYR